MKYSALVSLALGAATMAHATPVDTVQADANRPLNVIDTVRAMVQKSIAKNGPRPVKQVAPDAQADALLPPLPILSGNNTSKGCSPNCNSTLKFSTAQAKAMEIGNNIPGIPFPVRNSWGGNIPIGTDKNTTLYSWLWGAEQKSDDLVIWLQGGPGCSSLSGMLQEVGPFQYFDVGDTPYVNPYSWTNAANILFVESPLGTGYSTGVPTAKDENDVAAQFASFLDNYYKVFPELKSNKLWIVGESYGGAYVPYISNYQYKIGNPHNLQGVGIIDGTFTNRPIQTDVVTYSYAKRHQKEIGLTDGDIAQIKAVSDQCGYTGFEDRYLKYPPTEKFATPSCAQSAQNTFFDLAMQRNPCFNVYHVTDKCPTPISVLGDPNDPLQSVKPTYFDNLAVKKYIHAPLLKKWNLCNSGVFPNGDSSPPSDSNGVLKNVIESSVRSFISQGDLDGLIVTNGSALALQNFVWNGQQGFTKKPSADVVADGKVWGKYITQRNLTFIEYFAAGHGNPTYVPVPALKMIKFLIGKVSTLS